MLITIVSDFKTHVFSVISYMSPLVIAVAIIIAISRVGGSFYHIPDICDAKSAECASSIFFFQA
ncbi:hypothetical protein BGU90_19775, partial [Clostridioides difficile]